MKFCRDCKWMRLSDVFPKDYKYNECIAPVSFVSVNLVTGEKEQKFSGYCSQLRSFNREDTCGEAGAWFEPLSLPIEKEEKDVEGEGTQ